jgi:integrase
MANKKITTDMQAKAVKLPADKTKIKVTLGDGLCLHINQSGKYWKYAYKFDGKRKEASLGVYPTVSLKEAKNKLLEVKVKLAKGINPNAKAKVVTHQGSFEKIARQWHGTHINRWSEGHASTILRRFEIHVFPHLGHIPISELTKVQVSDVLIGIADRGTLEIAKRIGQIIRQVLEYACERGLIELPPIGNTKSYLPKRKAKPMPAITDKKRIGLLLRSIRAYSGSYVVRSALMILPYLAVRSGEFREAEWDEFDLDKALWTIPAKHRKLSKEEKEDPKNFHLVPLSKQVVLLLRELHEFSGAGIRVFPSPRGDPRILSDGTINAALEALGFDDMVGHGWRTVFSTFLNEFGCNPDAIERQLAHVLKDKVRAAYNRSDYFELRVEMMQVWADMLDELRKGENAATLS